MSEKKPDTVLECSLKYTLNGPDRIPQAQGEAKAVLSTHDLALRPSMGRALLFSLREIDSLATSSYRVRLSLSSAETLELYHLGQRYDDFCRELTRLRHELMIQDLLMQERALELGLKGSYTRTRGVGREDTGGPCEVRLYETALLVLPQTGNLERIPYSFISTVRDQGYTLQVEVEDDGLLTLSRFGPGLDLLRRTLSATMSDLTLATQRYLQELLPSVAPSDIRRAAPLFRDGRAARRADVEAISPDLWLALEERLAQQAGMAEKYAFLRSLAPAPEVSAGMKRGLMGDLTGDYMWVLVPVCSGDPSEPGNAVALEATSSKGAGRATYFFRLAGRQEYPDLTADLLGLHARAAAFSRTLSRCLLAVNFRREPIYLSAAKLKEPRYERYSAALRLIPELRELRDRFIGRVVHSSHEQWRRDVMDLLRFNVETVSDLPKWRAATAGHDGAGDEDIGDFAGPDGQDEDPDGKGES
jgi:hypothetical protein